MELNFNAENKRYMDLFYEPRMAAYDFLKLFFAVLYSKHGVQEITRDISEPLYKLKKKSEYSELLKEIKFRSNGIHLYSNQIEDSISSLQNVELLGKKNPSFGRILIEYNEKIVSDIFDSNKAEDIELMEDLVEEMKAEEGGF